MTKVEELEKAVLMLEEQVETNKTMSETYLKDLELAKKQLRDVNDNNDIQQVGKVNNELLRIIDSSISKKLEIVKLQISLVKSEDSSESTSSVHLTDEDKELIQTMIKESEEGDDKGISYDV